MAHSTAISPIRETADVTPQPAPVRRAAMPSGNRSWTEEEETYLLQTRQQKMPYKHIAAHLNKTELACRLHYHQLFHGSHRRKRSSSVASSLSNGSSPDMRQYRASSEMANNSCTPDFHSRARSYSQQPSSQRSRSSSSTSSTPGSRAPKALLPKPMPMTPDESPRQHYQGLHMQQALPALPQPALAPVNPVDNDRLRMIYESHRQAFWSSITQEYGKEISPATVEDMWRSNVGAPQTTYGQRPLTPPEHYPQEIPQQKSSLPFPSYYAPQPVAPTSYAYPPMQPTAAPQYRSLAPIAEPLSYLPPRPTSMSRRSTNSSTSSERVPINALLTDNKTPVREQFDTRPMGAIRA